MAPRRLRTFGNASRLFLDLIRPEGPRGCAEATADDLQRAGALACRHGLFLLVDRRIREHAVLFPAGLAAGGYERSTRLPRLRHISHAVHYERVEGDVLSLLDAAGIPSVILKGSALSRDLYGERSCRTSGDIDLLVRPEDVPATDAALTAAGYRRDNDRPLSFWMRRLHHAVYLRPGSGVPVEIHWHFSIPGFFNLSPERIWAGVELEGLRGRLNTEMSMTLLLMHHHLHGCADLRTLIDLVWAFERHRELLDSDRWQKLLESTGLRVVAGIARLQAEMLWGAHLPDPGGAGAHQGLRVRLLASAAGALLRPGRRPRASDRYLHALIHRVGLDSPRRVIASIMKTLVPPVADIRALDSGERGGLSGYVRYFWWRLGGRTAGDEEQGRLQR